MAAPSSASTLDKEVEDIVQKKLILDVNFHPSKDIIASALINGKICLHSFSTEENKPLFQINYHKEACRQVMFSPDGTLLYSGSSDRSIASFDVENKKLVFHTSDEKDDTAHKASINCVQQYDDKLLVSGDDDGVVKLWDVRNRSMKCVMTFEEHEDFISDFCCRPSQKHLLATSGDGCLSVYDIRGKGKVIKVSDNQEDELLSVLVMKNGTKVVCGTQSGVLTIFSYGMFGDLDDRFPGHPNSVDTMVLVDEDTMVTGSSDGLLRIVQVHPNKLLGVLGEHEDLPIEVIRQNKQKTWMASVSHDSRIKFWDVRYLYDDDDEDMELQQEEEMDDVPSTALKFSNKKDFYDGF